MKRKILLIDDEINILRVLRAALGKTYEVSTAKTAKEALSILTSEKVDLILSDYKLPDMDGIELLERVREELPDTPFIIITAYGTIERAVEAMKKGAYTYLTKPVNLDVLYSIVREAISGDGPSQRNSKDNGDNHQLLNLLGKSKAMKEVFTTIKRVSKTDARVLILGETGTGKELVARALHYSSLRACKPFITIDCTTIPKDLLESELFGYDKGAFTCAYEDKVGLIEMADGGTLFFDEIGDLEYSLQKKLLRFIQEKEFSRVGSNKKVSVDVRIIAATNRDLEDAVKRGDFRADLFYRLNVISIHIPPLRERKEDIPLLAQHFLEIYRKNIGKDIKGIEPEVIKILTDYDWPGNVRELENVIERAVILCNYDLITRDCIPQKLICPSDGGSSSIEDYQGFNLLDIERKVILSALNESSWNQSMASRLLGISRKQLRTKMKNLNIPFVPDPHLRSGKE
jgi:two-component system response regulator HydG/two-component system response regulator AtoC